MRKVWAVIRREFLERVRTRAFILGTLLGPVLFGGLMVVPLLLELRARDPTRIAVVDAMPSPGLGRRIEQALRSATRIGVPGGRPRYLVERVEAEGRLLPVRDSLIALTDRRDLGDRSLAGVLLVTDGVLTGDTIRYLGSDVGSLGQMSSLAGTLQQAVMLEKLERAEVNPAMVMRAVAPVELNTSKVSRGKLTGESGEASFALAYAMTLLLYMALLMYGVQVMTSVVEEKANRINEILVSSLSPFQLFLGKIVGVGSVGLLQMGVWAGTATLLFGQRGRIAGWLGVSPDAVAGLQLPSIPPALLVVFLLFFLLGFFLYAAAFAAVGATANTVPETQQAQMPVMLLIMTGMFLMFSLLEEPNGRLARVLSLVPPYAPFVTPVRYSLSPLPWPELLLSVAVTMLGVLLVAWLAGRIYRVGILMYGKRASVREVWRWLRAG